MSATQRDVPSGSFSSTQISSHQTLVPPSHGILSGKFAPPATMSASPCTPANGPATPGCFACPADGGSGGSSSQVRFITLAEERGSIHGNESAMISRRRVRAVCPHSSNQHGYRARATGPLRFRCEEIFAIGKPFKIEARHTEEAQAEESAGVVTTFMETQDRSVGRNRNICVANAAALNRFRDWPVASRKAGESRTAASRLLDDNHGGLPAAGSQPFLCRLFAQRVITVRRRGARFGRRPPVRRYRRTVFRNNCGASSRQRRVPRRKRLGHRRRPRHA